MKRRGTWFGGVAFLALVLAPSLAAEARCYHATMGQWVQRDPAGQADGMNPYLYVSGAPNDSLDPMGLWKIERKGERTATAEAEKGDTVEKLAKIIGLDADRPGKDDKPSNQFYRWLKLSGLTIDLANGEFRDELNLEKDDVICPGQKVKVPNTILAVWAGWEGLGPEVAKSFVMWHKDINDLKGKGFAVVEKENKTAPDLIGAFYDLSIHRQLHGFLFWGHGAPWGLVTKESENNRISGPYRLIYDQLAPQLRYRIGFVMVYACYGDYIRDPYLGIVSPNAIGWGGHGEIQPQPFHTNAPTVDGLLGGGAQGTNP
jgi:hypothetical protein